MARKSKKRSRRFESRQQQRETGVFSNITGDMLLRDIFRNEIFPEDDFPVQKLDPTPDDLRSWRPQLNRYLTRQGRIAKITADRKKFKKEQIGKMYFAKPEDVTICKNRSQRRQTLFSQRKIGKGISGPKKRKYTDKSKVRCS